MYIYQKESTYSNNTFIDSLQEDKVEKIPKLIAMNDKISYEEALEKFKNSSSYQKLMQPSTGFYLKGYYELFMEYYFPNKIDEIIMQIAVFYQISEEEAYDRFVFSSTYQRMIHNELNFDEKFKYYEQYYTKQEEKKLNDTILTGNEFYCACMNTIFAYYSKEAETGKEKTKIINNKTKRLSCMFPCC